MSGKNPNFPPDAKVVISPDQMRAWIKLPPPGPGVKYSAGAVAEWLPENGVVYGADSSLIQKAVESKRYDELLEVARGNAPVAATGEDYKILIDLSPFTGLKGNSDGSLQYDEFSFLTEAEENQILAEISPGKAGKAGMTVTGEELQPKDTAENNRLGGSGFDITDNGRYYRAPSLSHISLVEGKLIVTPLIKYEYISEEDGNLEFDGNIFVEKDIHPASAVKCSGSLFVAGRAVSSRLNAGRNIMLAKGASGQNGFCLITAGDNVWGQGFDGCEISAGKDICANHLAGCEAKCNGRALILGGRATIVSSNISAKEGIVTGTIGNGQDSSAVSAGYDNKFLDNFDSIEKRINKLNLDLQSLQKNMSAIEKLHKGKPDKIKNNPSYKEMSAKKSQTISVLKILESERTRTKRLIDQYSTVNIVARVRCYPGALVSINSRNVNIIERLEKVKFKQDGEFVGIISQRS